MLNLNLHLVPTFNRSKFFEWTVTMKTWLKEHQLWEITTGVECQPSRALVQANPEQACLMAIAKRDQKNKDEPASGSIMLCLELSIHPMVNGTKTAKYIWDQLQASFGKQSADQLITDYKSIVTMMMMAVDNPQHIINQMTIKFGCLATNGFMISDHIQALTLLAAVPHVHQRCAQKFLMSAPPKDMNFVMVKDTFLLEHLLMEDEMYCRAGFKEVPGITYVGGPSHLDQANKIAPCMHPLAKSVNNFKGKHTAQKFLLQNNVMSEPLALPQVKILQPLLPVPPPPMPTPGLEAFPLLPGKTNRIPDGQSPDIHPSSLKNKEMTLPIATGLSRPSAAIPPFIQQKVRKERKCVWRLGDMTPLDEWVNRYDVLSYKESFTQSS